MIAPAPFVAIQSVQRTLTACFVGQQPARPPPLALVLEAAVASQDNENVMASTAQPPRERVAREGPGREQRGEAIGERRSG
jgi:hypothetical protein